MHSTIIQTGRLTEISKVLAPLVDRSHDMSKPSVVKELILKSNSSHASKVAGEEPFDTGNSNRKDTP